MDKLTREQLYAVIRLLAGTIASEMAGKGDDEEALRGYYIQEAIQEVRENERLKKDDDAH